jgi:uncharacterized protein involved in exopolysaccharide biosynthesis
MDQNNQNCEEMEIDLNQYIKVIPKRKMTFITVFLLIFAIGIACVLFSPKIFRISMMIQPPVSGVVLTGANDLESAENLKGLIINKVFNDELSRRLNLDPGKAFVEFNVIIPNKTNILLVSVDFESINKEFGLILLRNLSDLISESYAKRIEADRADIASQIKFNERAIINAKEKVKNLEEQIKEVASRENKLREEIKFVNTNTAQILEKREGLLKGNATTESASTLLLANYLQNNSSYLNHVNNQFSELTIRRVNLDLELKNTTSQISDFQMAIDKLNIRSNFISNLRIISQPRVSSHPISPEKKKILAVSVVMGLFFGLIAIFFHEFWANNLKKK